LFYIYYTAFTSHDKAVIAKFRVIFTRAFTPEKELTFSLNSYDFHFGLSLLVFELVAIFFEQTECRWIFWRKRNTT